MHLLLYPGTEVLIAHIDGDPDRPIIVGAVHNEATRSPVTNADNPDASVIFTQGGIEIEMYDPPSDG
jgi:type VI secretion system secreted protein VgrG